MKSYSQFVTEAYSARDELNEVVGAIARGAGRFIPGLQTAYGLYRGTSALMRGDKTGAALGYGSALPGPLGWGFAAADIGRDLAGGGQQQTAKPKPEEKPKAAPAPAAQADTTQSAATPPANNTLADKVKSQMVLAKKGGVEGKLDKATGKFTPGAFSGAEKQRYETKRGTEQLASDAAKVKYSEPKDYVGQKIKPLELKKPVTVQPAKFTLPKISA